jgi:hypothetical protein
MLLNHPIAYFWPMTHMEHVHGVGVEFWMLITDWTVYCSIIYIRLLLCLTVFSHDEVPGFATVSSQAAFYACACKRVR